MKKPTCPRCKNNKHVHKEEGIWYCVVAKGGCGIAVADEVIEIPCPILLPVTVEHGDSFRAELYAAPNDKGVREILYQGKKDVAMWLAGRING